MRVEMIYASDGTVSMTSLLMSGSGSWSYSADGICMVMTSGPRRGKTCVTFEPLGGGKYVNSERDHTDRSRISSGLERVPC